MVASQLRGYGVWDGSVARDGSLLACCKGPAPSLLFLWVTDAQANLLQMELSAIQTSATTSGKQLKCSRHQYIIYTSDGDVRRGKCHANAVFSFKKNVVRKQSEGGVKCRAEHRFKRSTNQEPGFSVLTKAGKTVSGSCFSPPVLHPPAGVGEAASGT